MTDKIIIDGVDVKDCEFYLRLDNGVQACLSNDLGNCCETNHNCYYKQLQRTIAQCNAVVEQNKSLQQNFNKYKKSKQASYEAVQRKLNETDVEKKFFEAFGIEEKGEVDWLKPEYANQSVCKKCEKK